MQISIFNMDKGKYEDMGFSNMIKIAVNGQEIRISFDEYFLICCEKSMVMKPRAGNAIAIKEEPFI